MKKTKYSNRLSITKLVFLTFITAGIYRLGWLIKNWLDIKEDTKKEVSGFHIVALFIPIVNIFNIYFQFENIKELAQEKNIKVKWSPGWITFWFIILGALSFSLFDRTAPLFILTLSLIALSLIPIISVQDALNDFWGKTQKLPERKWLSEGEIIWTVAGVILWILILI